jgi:dTMP kinase
MIESTIRPAIADGKSVVSDRFLLANVVYQSVGNDEVSPELLWQMGRLAAGGLRPDLTILLDMPAAAALDRLGATRDRMESRGVEYLESVRRAFLDQLPESGEDSVVINASQPVDQVTADMLMAVDRHLDGRRS